MNELFQNCFSLFHLVSGHISTVKLIGSTCFVFVSGVSRKHRCHAQKRNTDRVAEGLSLSGGEGVVAGYFREVAGVVYCEYADVGSAADLETVDAAV